MERFKVAIVCDWYLPRIGGLEIHLLDLAHELNARGHEAHIICSTPDGPAREAGGRRDARSTAPLTVHRLDVPMMPGLAVIRSRRVLEPLEKLLREQRYDVVHCHTALSPLSHAGAFAARRLGLPSVLTEHSVLRGAGHRVLSALHRMSGWADWPDVLTAVSNYVADEIRRVSGRDEVYVLPNGIDPDEWPVSGIGVDGDELRVTSVMRMTRRKRGIDIVRAIPRIQAALPPGVKPRFVIIGDGPERKRVEREAKRLGVTDRVELPGFRSRDEIKEALARSSLFVLPTSKEALSIATLEARCAGLPVVAMNHGGVGDLIRHGVDGYLAADPTEWVAHIARVLADQPLRRRMADATRESVGRFSWDRVIQQHVDLYQLARERKLGLAGRAHAGAARKGRSRRHPAYLDGGASAARTIAGDSVPATR